MKEVLGNIANVFTLDNLGNLGAVWWIVLATVVGVFLVSKVHVFLKIIVCAFLVLLALKVFGLIPTAL